MIQEPLNHVEITPPEGQGAPWCMKNQTAYKADILIKKWGALPGYRVTKIESDETYVRGGCGWS